MPFNNPSHYDRLFERFTASPVTRHWDGITIRQDSGGLFRLEDVLAVCGVERTGAIVSLLRERWKGDNFAMRFDGRRWHYWASLPACLSIVNVPPELSDRMKLWEKDGSGIIDRFC